MVVLLFYCILMNSLHLSSCQSSLCQNTVCLVLNSMSYMSDIEFTSVALQVTSDWSMQQGTGCTDGHTGTSAAAPLAAGMVALMLQVRPCLSWRDVQHIIAFTATKVSQFKHQSLLVPELLSENLIFLPL